ncbi:hypothetical protein E1182_21405 [Micromonospora sp. KC721]|nr:hypothetical protein E1182_21405 [Micromonospora sp. KC721]
MPRAPVQRRPGVPAPGDLVLIDRRASVQFGGDRALWLRVSSVCEKPTYHGWVWLTGYSTDLATGKALARREVYVQIAGLQIQRRTPESAPPRNVAPVMRRRRV